MRDEIFAAVLFLTRLIAKNNNLSSDQVEHFKTTLCALLQERFQNHWFPDQPFKGQGYRCIRVNELNRIDPVLLCAARECGLRYEDLQLPMELTIWVDPHEVCCRFGEHKGSYCTLASFKKDIRKNYVDCITIDDVACRSMATNTSYRNMANNRAAVLNTVESVSPGVSSESFSLNNTPHHLQQQQQTMLEENNTARTFTHTTNTTSLLITTSPSQCYLLPFHSNMTHTNTAVMSSSPPPSLSLLHGGGAAILPPPPPPPPPGSVRQGICYTFAPSPRHLPFSPEQYHWVKRTIIKA